MSFLKKYAVSIIILIILIFYLGSNVTIEDLSKVVSKIDFKFIFIIGFATYLGSIARGLRWYLFTRQLKVKLPYKEILKMVFFSTYLNLLVPGRAGDVFSVFYFKKHKISASHSLGGMFLERISDLSFLLVSIPIFIPFGFALIKNPEFKKYAIYAIIGGVVIVSLIFSLLILLFKKKSFLKKIPFIKKFDTDKVVDKFKEGIKIITKDKIVFLKYCLFTIIRWVPEFFMYYLVFFAIGIDLNIMLLISFTLIASLLYAIPLFPGALGLLEGFVILFFKSFGRTEAEGTVFILILRTFTILFFIIPLSILTNKIGKEVTDILKSMKNEI